MIKNASNQKIDTTLKNHFLTFMALLLDPVSFWNFKVLNVHFVFCSGVSVWQERLQIPESAPLLVRAEPPQPKTKCIYVKVGL